MSSFRLMVKENFQYLQVIFPESCSFLQLCCNGSQTNILAPRLGEIRPAQTVVALARLESRNFRVWQV